MFGKVRTCMLNMPMNEGNGDPHDSSGYDNIITNHGADWVSGRRGYALDFNGNTDYVDCGNDKIIQFGDHPLTISCWYKIVDKTNQVLIGWGTGSPPCPGIHLRLLDTRPIIYLGNSNYRYFESPGWDDDWHHVAAIITGNSQNDINDSEMYIDGVELGVNQTVNGGACSASALTYLMRFYTFYTNGSIDQVRIYNRALSATEILANFNAESTITRDCVLNMPMNEGQGHPHDSSGYGNNGTNNGADWVSGDYGWAMDFNGSSDFVECVDVASLNITDAITVSVWMNPSATHDSYDHVLGKRSAVAGYYIISDAIGNDWLDFVVKIGYSRVAQTNTYPPVGQWSHIVGTYDGSRVRVYMNGIEQTHGANVTGNIDTTKNPLRIGYYESYGFNGSIDQPRVYNRALSAAEILDYFNGVKARYGL